MCSSISATARRSQSRSSACAAGMRKQSTSSRTTWSSSPTAAAPRIPLWGMTIMPPHAVPRTVKAAAGSFGRTSPSRTLPSAIPRSSAPTSKPQLGIRHRYYAGRPHPGVFGEDVQARPVLGQGCHRRHHHRERFQVADELHLQPPTALSGTAQGTAGGLDLRAVHRCSRRFCQETHAGMYRHGNCGGMALPHGCA